MPKFAIQTFLKKISGKILDKLCMSNDVLQILWPEQLPIGNFEKFDRRIENFELKNLKKLAIKSEKF